MVFADERVLELTGPLFDGLYEYCRRAHAAGPGARVTAAARPAHTPLWTASRARPPGSAAVLRYFLRLGDPEPQVVCVPPARS
jgi:hypothetical protein